MILTKRFVVLWLGLGAVLVVGSCQKKARATTTTEPINFRVAGYNSKLKVYVFRPMLPISLGVTDVTKVEGLSGIHEHEAIQCKAEARFQGETNGAKAYATFLKCDHKTEFLVNSIDFNYSEE